MGRPARFTQRTYTSIRVLTRRNLAEIYEHARRCYPEECCGFIYASGRVHRAVNDQSRLHREDPTNFSPTSREAYSFSAEDLLILNESFVSSDPPVIIYHSHVDVGAYFSDHDVTNAVHEGRLVYDVDFLVVDARAAGAKESKLFRYTAKGFECLWSDMDKS